MTFNPDLTPVADAFFLPLLGLAAQSPNHHPCPEFSDEDFLHLGVQRVLEQSESGRGFLQEQGPRFEHTPKHSNYFAALHSPRRCSMLRDVSEALLKKADALLPDLLADIPELEGYECFALDGHWHKAATHDPRHDGVKMSVGHFYGLNLRRHTFRHLAAAEGLHEHDMSALKRLKPKGLRQQVPKGKRTLLVYDKAGIDFGFWKRCRQECAIYFISRVKGKMFFSWVGDAQWDREDSRNNGVLDDRKVETRQGLPMRIINYMDPQSREHYEFLTNEPDLPPGIIAELYRRRWNIEKVFDQIKNKLNEKKAWATSLVAKEAQALLVTLTHNLLLLYEDRLETEHGAGNMAEDWRRGQRAEEAGVKCATAGKPLSPLVLGMKRATQRSVKFIRWLRHAIREKLAETIAVPRLRQLYATL